MSSLQAIKIQQTFPRPRLLEIESAVTQEIAPLAGMLRPNARIAITVGSRGIADITRVVKTVVDLAKRQGALPFIIPAMGSHGGGTAEGQTEILASYGITEATMGAPVRATMEVVDLTPPGAPCPVFMDRYAYDSDGVILINRVKPHTDFHGSHESGLVKMSVIGLGKHRQALAIHTRGVYGLRELIPVTARTILASGKVLFGVAIVENAYDETMAIKAWHASEIMAREPELLALARANMPSLPVDELDVLIIDQMGKNISGAGIDPNIIGRNRIRGEAEPEAPRIKTLVVTDLTEASHGNAVGIGLADVATQRLFNKIDFRATNENTVTSSFLDRGKLPVIAESDAQAYAWALRGCNLREPEAARVIRVRDTLHLAELYVSASVYQELRDRPGIETLKPLAAVFAESGELTRF